MHISLVMTPAMHITLDNICFYDHPPAKPSSRALPSCWRAYNPSVGPQNNPLAFSPRSHSPDNLLSDAGVGIVSQFQAPAREQPDSGVGSDFDLEIQRSLSQNSRIADETDLGRHLFPGLQDEFPIDVHTGGQTSPTSDDIPSRVTLGGLNIPSTNKDPQCSRPGSPLALNDSLGWHRDIISPLKSRNKTDRALLSSESSLLCPRVLSTPLPDLPVCPSIETSIQDGSIVAETERVENSGNRTEILEGDAVAPSVQVTEPSASKALSGEDAIGRLTEDSHSSVPFCLASHSRSTSQSQTIPAKMSSPRPWRNARSTRRELFPAISVVIPTRRNDESTRNNRITASKRSRQPGSSDNGRETQRPLDGDYPPHSDKPKYKVDCRSPKRRKKAKKKHLPSSNAGEKCTYQPEKPSEDGMTCTLGKIEEIFGRGVLRIQANGPRHAYFMTFLPEVVSHHPPMSSQTSHGQQPCDQMTPENDTTRKVRLGKRCRRSVSTVGEKGEGEPSEIQQTSFFCGGNNGPRKNFRRHSKWTTEQIDCLKSLRRGRRRPWSEVTREFLHQYPGRSPGAVQAYCSTHRL